MRRLPVRRSLFAVAIVTGAVFAGVTLASAEHSWGTYHWGRTANPFTLQVVDSMTSSWDPTLGAVSFDWSQSSVLDTAVVAGDDSVKARKTCKPVSGKIRACNAPYGFNGWLGMATIWISGGHIVQGTAKQNDSYFNTSTYNDANAKRHVLCQEVGHTFGLDHQPYAEQSCMSGGGLFDSAYVSPNAHDYEQLETIYNAHTDGSNTYSTSSASSGPPGPGAAADDAVPAGAGPRDGNVFVRDLGGGRLMITFVTWVEPGP